MSEDDLFEGAPEEKWLEILAHANKTLVSQELLYLLEYLGRCELYLEACDPAWEEKLRSSCVNPSLLKQKKGSLAIESMGRILTQNE